MTHNLISTSTIEIKASPEKIWDALTNPQIIKEYLFGTNAASDWKKGSKITYSGDWEGKPYEDHGVITEIIPNEILKTTYWSSAFGEDSPENYKNVEYKIQNNGKTTTLTITQDGNKTEEEKTKSEKNWKTILESMKNLLEK